MKKMNRFESVPNKCRAAIERSVRAVTWSGLLALVAMAPLASADSMMKEPAKKMDGNMHETTMEKQQMGQDGMMKADDKMMKQEDKMMEKEEMATKPMKDEGMMDKSMKK